MYSEYELRDMIGCHLKTIKNNLDRSRAQNHAVDAQLIHGCFDSIMGIACDHFPDASLENCVKYFKYKSIGEVSFDMVPIVAVQLVIVHWDSGIRLGTWRCENWPRFVKKYVHVLCDYESRSKKNA